MRNLIEVFAILAMAMLITFIAGSFTSTLY
jgi:hypothetical protein